MTSACTFNGVEVRYSSNVNTEKLNVLTNFKKLLGVLDLKAHDMPKFMFRV